MNINQNKINDDLNNPSDQTNNDELQNEKTNKKFHNYIDSFLSHDDIENQDEDILDSQINELNDDSIRENDKVTLDEDDLNRSW